MKQITITLQARKRGFYLIDQEIKSALKKSLNGSGLVHLLLMHTSASLFVSENTCDDVRADFESFISQLIPEDAPFTHIAEGSDDMPAHIKSAFLGCNVTLPFSDGEFIWGTWQGLYLGEHRNAAGNRKILATILK